MWVQFPALRCPSSVISDGRLHPCMPGILHQKMGMSLGCRLNVGEMVRGRGRPQERGVCISLGSGGPGVAFGAGGGQDALPLSVPVSLCPLRLGKRFVDRRPWRWGWGKDRLGLPASLPAAPQPLRLRVLHPWPGAPGAFPDRAFPVPTPGGPGPGRPQGSPTIRETGPRWVFVNLQPSEGGASTCPSARREAVGLLCRRAKGAGPGAPLGFTPAG